MKKNNNTDNNNKITAIKITAVLITTIITATMVIIIYPLKYNINIILFYSFLL